MNLEIIKKKGNKWVNLRQIHHGIGSKRQFANWKMERVNKWGLVEGKEVFNNFVKNPSSEGGRPLEETFVDYRYAIAIGASENTEQSQAFLKAVIDKMEEISRRDRLNATATGIMAGRIGSSKEDTRMKDENETLKQENANLWNILESKSEAKRYFSKQSAGTRIGDILGTQVNGLIRREH